MPTSEEPDSATVRNWREPRREPRNATSSSSALRPLCAFVRGHAHKARTAWERDDLKSAKMVAEEKKAGRDTTAYGEPVSGKFRCAEVRFGLGRRRMEGLPGGRCAF